MACLIVGFFLLNHIYYVPFQRQYHSRIYRLTITDDNVLREGRQGLRKNTGNTLGANAEAGRPFMRDDCMVIFTHFSRRKHTQKSPITMRGLREKIGRK